MNHKDKFNYGMYLTTIILSVVVSLIFSGFVFQPYSKFYLGSESADIDAFFSILILARVFPIIFLVTFVFTKISFKLYSIPKKIGVIFLILIISYLFAEIYEYFLDYFDINSKSNKMELVHKYSTKEKCFSFVIIFINHSIYNLLPLVLTDFAKNIINKYRR